MTDSQENDTSKGTPVEGVEVPLVESVEVPLVEPDNNYSKATVPTSDDELRNVGAGIALCAILILFVSSTFTIWSLELSSKSESNMEWEYTFGVDEMEVEATGLDSDLDGDFEYSDSDCNCNDMESFFGNLKILVYLVLICGAALAYMGHTGEKREFEAKVIAAVAVFSVIIALYTFTALPKAVEEDFEFEDIEVKFMGSDTYESDGVKVEAEGSLGLGYIVSLVPLGLASYLIKTRKITLEDITGKQ